MINVYNNVKIAVFLNAFRVLVEEGIESGDSILPAGDFDVRIGKETGKKTNDYRESENTIFIRVKNYRFLRSIQTESKKW